MGRVVALGHPICATCKGRRVVAQRDGTEVPCMPCSTDPKQTTGADPIGPGGATSETESHQ